MCIDAGTLTSAAMLGYKLAHTEVIKFAMDENARLQQERTALLDELEGSLNPELALQVEQIIDRRSFMQEVMLIPRKNTVCESAKAEETPGSAREVRSTDRLPHYRSPVRLQAPGLRV